MNKQCQQCKNAAVCLPQGFHKYYRRIFHQALLDAGIETKLPNPHRVADRVAFKVWGDNTKTRLRLLHDKVSSRFPCRKLEMWVWDESPKDLDIVSIDYEFQERQ